MSLYDRIKRNDAPTKSTAARKADVQRRTTDVEKSAEVLGHSRGMPSEISASPVDTIPKPKRGRPPKPGADKAEYNRQYMRDLRKAKPLGMTVKEWREKNGKD